MLKILLFAFLSTSTISLLAQEEFPENKEGFDHLAKGTIRKEIASFSYYGEKEKNKSIKPGKTFITLSRNDRYTFKRDSITVTIKSKPFEKSKYKIRRNADGLILTMNGKIWFGKDFSDKLPATVMQSVVITIGTDSLRLPQSALANLFEPTLNGMGNCPEGDCDSPQIYISSDKKRIYIYTMNSGDAGTYEVTWIIQDKKYLRRVVDYGW